jgi:hypothetical protein
MRTRCSSAAAAAAAARATMLRWAVIAAAAAMTTAVLVSPASAEAARATIRDARGDADARWDFTRIRVDNGRRRLRVEIFYRGALRTSTGFLADVGFDLGSPASSPYIPDYTADLLMNWRGSPDRRQLIRGTRHVQCKGFRIDVRARRGRIRVTVPQRCFGDAAGRVRLVVHSYQVRGDAREADYMDEYSRWIRRG